MRAKELETAKIWSVATKKRWAQTPPIDAEVWSARACMPPTKPTKSWTTFWNKSSCSG